MPEGGEIEAMRQGLLGMLGQTVVPKVSFEHRKFFDAKAARTHRGDRVRTIIRHGKRLAIYTNRGILLVEAGMSGYWHAAPTRSGGTRKHDIFRLETATTTYYYNDARRFGSAVWYPLGTDWIELKRMGPDGFSELMIAPGRGRLLRERFEHHPRWPIKVALLDQSLIAGLGNYCASEVLWRTRTHPETPIAAFHQWSRLARTSFWVLNRALVGRGTTLRGANKYRPVDGARNTGLTMAAYDRAGEPCYRCGEPIEGYHLAGRSTYYCPRCQTLPELGD